MQAYWQSQYARIATKQSNIYIYIYIYIYNIEKYDIGPESIKTGLLNKFRVQIIKIMNYKPNIRKCNIQYDTVSGPRQVTQPLLYAAAAAAAAAAAMWLLLMVYWYATAPCVLHQQHLQQEKKSVAFSFLQILLLLFKKYFFPCQYCYCAAVMLLLADMLPC